jgi:hypothetical protein
VEEGVVTRAADGEEGKCDVAEAGRRRVQRGPELSHRRSGLPDMESFTVRPEGSNSTEQ